MREWTALGIGLAMWMLVSPAQAIETTTPGVEAPYGWKDGITLAIAVLGAVLGILNYWNTISMRRVRVLVKPAHAIPVGRGVSEHISFAIEVANLSAFPVTVAEIGFTASGGRIVIPDPTVIDGEPWPRRLEPRAAVNLYFNPHSSISPGTQIQKAYARLASGEVPTGTSPALKQLRDQIARG